jgi:hypothetical protein
MARGRYSAQHLRIVGGVLAYRKERRTHAFISQGLDNCVGGWPRPIVKGQDDFFIAQEVMLLEMFEAKSWSPTGIDLDHTRHAECMGIPANWVRGDGHIGVAAEAEFAGGGNETVEVDTACDSSDAKIGGEGFVPVTSSGSATFAGIAARAGSWTELDRPKL